MTAPRPQWVLDTSCREMTGTSPTVCKSVMTSHCNWQSLSHGGPRHSPCKMVTYWKRLRRAASVVQSIGHTDPFLEANTNTKALNCNRLRPLPTSLQVRAQSSKAPPCPTATPTKMDFRRIPYLVFKFVGKFRFLLQSNKNKTKFM